MRDEAGESSRRTTPTHYRACRKDPNGSVSWRRPGECSRRSFHHTTHIPRVHLHYHQSNIRSWNPHDMHIPTGPPSEGSYTASQRMSLHYSMRHIPRDVFQDLQVSSARFAEKKQFPGRLCTFPGVLRVQEPAVILHQHRLPQRKAQEEQSEYNQYSCTELEWQFVNLTSP